MTRILVLPPLATAFLAGCLTSKSPGARLVERAAAALGGLDETPPYATKFAH